MSDDNKRFLDHLGVTAWHNAGYTGRRGLTATAEEIISPSTHAKETMAVFRLIAPDRQLIHLPMYGSYKDGVYTSKLIDVALPEILKQGVDTYYASLLANVCDLEQIDSALAALKDQCCLFFAAGNDGEQSSSKIIQSQYVWGVGAYYLMADTNEMRPAPFSSVSPDVEFCAPTLINRFAGTSCSAPCLCGMAALVNDMAIDKTGRPLPQQGMHRFLAGCAVDIGSKGEDDKTGIGAPVLPPPETVNIWDYQTEEGPMYTDEAKIPAWAKADVAYCRKNGILQGDKDGAFRPNEPVTRAELACALARLHRTLRA